MLQLQPLDPQMPIFRQLGSEDAPAILVNVFHVAEADIPDLLIAWEQDANWMKQQPHRLADGQRTLNCIRVSLAARRF